VCVWREEWRVKMDDGFLKRGIMDGADELGWLCGGEREEWNEQKDDRGINESLLHAL
jgi:hypothetical protein